ncbi:hypothetical protein EGW08_023226 [Elysia chlorotica]|uniref:Kazal-like domain-containing protein n=1 Tax=Elysia chlorotica TaxID=188477 RepID=A0A3S1BJY8_ELYCH|nr:hypothetical protein EGW08_023226 [Elysia chlorotica]
MQAVKRFKLAVAICTIASATTPVAATASCDPAPKACTKHAAPVCATFRKTFGNRCMMEAALCRLAKDGFHFEKVGEDFASCCSEAQPLIYWPTCASDGKTYDNLWAMENTACKNRDYLVEAPPNTCADFPKDWGSAFTGWPITGSK